MNAENPSMAKFQVVTQTNLPHRCITCGLNADGRIQFVDLGLSLDTEDPLFIGVPDSALGTLYLCINCASEMSAAIGQPSVAVVHDLSEAYHNSELQVERLERENARLRTLNDSYVDVLTSLRAIGGPTDPDEESGDSEADGSEQGLIEPSAE
jgi:hypothetical protein